MVLSLSLSVRGQPPYVGRALLRYPFIEGDVCDFRWIGWLI